MKQIIKNVNISDAEQSFHINEISRLQEHCVIIE